MEKLKCGRFIPREDNDNGARLRALETHLAALSEEMEYLILEMDRTLDLILSSIKAGEAATKGGGVDA